MPRNNGKKVISLQVEEGDALLLEIMAARGRSSVSEYIREAVMNVVMASEDILDKEGIFGDATGVNRRLRQELEAELQSWRADLERDGRMIDCRELNIRALVNASRKGTPKS